MVEELLQAIINVVDRADNSVLIEVINTAEALLPYKEKYTTSSWNSLSQALSKAKNVLDDEEADQKSVDEANTNNNGNNNVGNNPSNNGNMKGNDLPKTGGINSSYVGSIALIMMIIGGILTNKRKNNVTNN